MSVEGMAVMHGLLVCEYPGWGVSLAFVSYTAEDTGGWEGACVCVCMCVHGGWRDGRDIQPGHSRSSIPCINTGGCWCVEAPAAVPGLHLCPRREARRCSGGGGAEGTEGAGVAGRPQGRVAGRATHAPGGQAPRGAYKGTHRTRTASACPPPGQQPPHLLGGRLGEPPAGACRAPAWTQRFAPAPTPLVPPARAP